MFTMNFGQNGSPISRQRAEFNLMASEPNRKIPDGLAFQKQPLFYTSCNFTLGTDYINISNIC